MPYLLGELEEKGQAPSLITKGIAHSPEVLRLYVHYRLYVPAFGSLLVTGGRRNASFPRIKFKNAGGVVDTFILESAYQARWFADRIIRSIRRCGQAGEGNQLVSVAGNIEAGRPSEIFCLNVNGGDAYF